ncbi:MAG: lipopolysaccharide biosynthesis protein [Bacteroidales bacterium]
MSNLQQQAISGVKWTTVQTFVSAITGPVLLWIKTQFLSPEEFGLISIILVVTGLLKLLESFGISQAIIQKEDVSYRESSTLFFFNIIFSILLGVILFFTAPLIAQAYDMPALDFYLKLVIIIGLLVGPSLLFRAFLEKNLLFRQLSLIDMTGNILIFISTIVFLFLNLGVLSIILGHITGMLFTSIAITFSAFKYKVTRIQAVFKPMLMKPFISFGVFVSGKQLMTFLASRLDELIIGYLLSPEVLGIYYFGKNMLEKIRVLITKSFGKVLFPVFSKLKGDLHRLGNAYLRISRYISFGAFPVFIGIASTAHLFVPVFFGEQWLDSVIVFQVFSVSMIFMLLTANISSSLLYSLNQPRLVFFIDVVMNSLYLGTLLLFAKNGMVAILVIYSTYIIFKTITLQVFTNRYLKQTFARYLVQFTVPFVASLLMAFAVLLFQKALNTICDAALLFVGSFVLGIAVFTVLVYIFDRSTLADLKRALFKGEITVKK